MGEMGEMGESSFGVGKKTDVWLRLLNPYRRIDFRTNDCLIKLLKGESGWSR